MSDVSLTGVPDALANALGISLFPAQILASLLLISLFTLPVLFITKGKNLMVSLIVALLSMSFCVAVSWLSFWFMLIIPLLVALMFAGEMRDVVTGRGR